MQQFFAILFLGFTVGFIFGNMLGAYTTTIRADQIAGIIVEIIPGEKLPGCSSDACSVKTPSGIITLHGCDVDDCQVTRSP